MLYSVSHKMAAIKPNVFGYGPVRIKIKWLLMYRLKKGGGNLARVDNFTIGVFCSENGNLEIHMAPHRMAGHVGSVIRMSGIVKNMGISVGITFPSLSVQKLFPFPVWWPQFFSSGCRTISAVPFLGLGLSLAWSKKWG